MTEKDSQKDSEGLDVDKLKQQKEEYLEGWQRAKADLINYKKDETARLQEVARFANLEIVLDVINVIDSFELAISSMEKGGEVDKGIYMIKGQLLDILKKYGVQVLEVEEGQEFDPSIHEAVASISGGEEGKVADEVERGYKMHDRVIRAAKVKVYKKEDK